MLHSKRFFISILVLFFASFAFAEKDWLHIAENTDEPAVGVVVTEVFPDSAGADLGIKPGDYLASRDGSYFHVDRDILVDPPYELEIVKKGGSRRTETIESGRLGLSLDLVFRPWLCYLRSEIGTRGPWDDSVVLAMIRLYSFNQLPLKLWDEIRAQGYPKDDDLFRLVDMTIRWRQGQTIEPSLFFQTWKGELPHAIFQILEKLAIANNDSLAVQKLAAINRGNLLLSDPAVLRFENSPEVGLQLRGANLLKHAKSIKQEDITSQLKGVEDPKVYLHALNPNQLLGNWPKVAPSNKYKQFVMVLPEDLSDIYYRISLVATIEKAELQAPTVRAEIIRSADTLEERKLFDGVSLARAGLIQTYYRPGGSKVSVLATTVGAPDWRFLPPENRNPFDEDLFTTQMIYPSQISIPVLLPQGRDKRAPKKWSKEITFELVKSKTEVAAFLNGVSYNNSTLSENYSKLAVTFYLSGAHAKINKCEVWRLGE